MHTPPTLPLHEPLKLMALIGALCSDLGAHDQSLAIFEHLVHLRDGHPNALVSLAVAQSRAGQDMPAQRTLRDVLQRQPLHDMARVMLAIELHKAGDDSARALLQAVLDTPHGPPGSASEEHDADALALAKSVQDEILAPPLVERPAGPSLPSGGGAALNERSSRLRYSRAPTA